MLPFLQSKKMAGVLIARHTDKGQEPMHMEGEPQPELLSAAESILRAIASKDAHELAEAIKAAIQCCGSES